MPSKHEKVYHKSKKDKTLYKEQLDKWEHTIQKQLPTLTKSQAYVLALWSFAMVILKSCNLCIFLASLLKTKEESLDTKQNSWRQRLREFCYDSDDKRGCKRKELHVETCFPYLMKWIIKWWDSDQLTIALDATTLELKFTVLAVSVVYVLYPLHITKTRKVNGTHNGLVCFMPLKITYPATTQSLS